MKSPAFLGLELVLGSWPEHGGCCEGNGGLKDLWASVVAGSDPSPVLEAPGHDLDPVAAIVAASVVFDRLSKRLPNRDTGLYPLGFLRTCGPIGIVPTVGHQPFHLWQAAQEVRRAGVISDLICSREKPDQATIGIGDGMQLGVQAALCAADQTAPLVACHPFFDLRQVAVQCDFK